MNRSFRSNSLSAVLLILTSLSVVSCVRDVPYTKYFILEYNPIIKDQTLKIDNPFPCSIKVSDMEIPRSYDSVRIVARYSSHQVNYYRYNLWAVRPHIVIADLMAKHFNSYELFERCQREFLDERPDYEVVGYINKIEKYDSVGYKAAHLNMTLYLYDYETNEAVRKYEFDREVELTTEEFNFFAKKISDIVREETDNFIRILIGYFREVYEPETYEEIVVDEVDSGEPAELEHDPDPAAERDPASDQAQDPADDQQIVPIDNL